MGFHADSLVQSTGCPAGKPAGEKSARLCLGRGRASGISSCFRVLDDPIGPDCTLCGQPDRAPVAAAGRSMVFTAVPEESAGMSSGSPLKHEGRKG